MVGETNAAIEGALAAGATDILVNDSHWNMYNLLPEDLHRSARVLQGEKAWSMVAGAQPAAGRIAGLRRRPVRRLPRPGRPRPRDDRPHLQRRARSRPAWPAGRPASTGSTPWSSGPGASRSGWSPATTPWPRRSSTGCRGPSGSSSSTADGTHSAISVAPGGRPRAHPGRGRGGRAPARGAREPVAARGRAAGRHRGRLRPGVRRRPRRRSCPAPSASATGPCASRPTIRSIAYRGFLAINRLAGAVD